MEENVTSLGSLLEQVAIKEKKIKKRFYYSLALPILIALILLAVFIYEINQARKTIDQLNQEKENLNQEIETRNQQIIEQKQNLENLQREIKNLDEAQANIESKFVKNLNWNENDLLVNDSTKKQNSKLAVEKIKNLFKSHTKDINLDLIIRYAMKKSDKEKVTNTLTKCGLRNIRVFITDYDKPIPTNKIAFSKKTTLSEVKLIAFALIWAGLDIKKIELYPPTRGKLIQTSHSVEISGDDDLNDFESISIEKIANAKSLDELFSPVSEEN